MLRKSFISFVTMFFISGGLFAQTVVGKYAGEFMSIGVGGRALGMGSAQVALVNDVTAGYWNPAGLAKINYPQGALMHEEHFGDLVNYNYAAVAIPYKNDMSFGISAIRLSVDGIPDTREAWVDKQTGQILTDINDPNGIFDKSKIKEFSNSDWVFYLTFAKRHADNFYWGVNAKIIYRELAEYTATGIGFDIGAYYQPFERLFLGANIMDVTTTLIAWDEGRNELVTPTVKVGAAYKIDFLGGTITPAIDLDMRFENRKFASNFNIGPVSFDHHFGLEYEFKNIVAVRGGYNDVKQFTVGAGVKLPKLNIDYTYANQTGSELETLPASHRISVMLTLEEPRFLRDGQ